MNKTVTARGAIPPLAGPRPKTRIASALLLACLASPASADTVFTYTGNAYTSCGGKYCTGGPYALSVSFQTTLTGSALINLPLTNVTNKVTSYNFTDGSGLTLNSSNNASGQLEIQIATDASGQIIAWFVGAYTSPAQTQMQTNWDSPTGFVRGADFSETSPNLSGDFGTVANKPGTWHMATTSGPTLVVAPASVSFSWDRTSGRVPPAQTLTVTSTGGPIAFTVGPITANWLIASTTSGTTPGQVALAVNASNLAPGTYTTSVTFASMGSVLAPIGGSVVDVPVTLVVSGGTSPITPSTQDVQFRSTVVNPTLRAQDVTITTTTGTLILYRTIVDQGNAPKPWLSAPASGYAPGVLTVLIDPRDLPAGTYTGKVTIITVGSVSVAALNDALPQDQSTDVNVTLTVAQGPTVGVAPAPQLFRFTYLRGWASPDGKSLIVSPVGKSQVQFSPATQTDIGGPWLNVLAKSPTAETDVTTWVDSMMLQGRAAGIYTGKITLTDEGGSVEQVPISARVLDAPDSTVPINYSSGSLNPTLPAVAFHTNDPQPTAFVADAASDKGWLSITPATGISGATIQPAINAAALPQGVYKGYYAVTAALNPTDAVVVGVTMTVGPPANTAPTITQVANAGSYAPQIAPNTFIMVKGTALADVDPKKYPNGRTWGEAPEIASGNLPQSLFGVQLLVNNTPAYISYLSATQINALLPIAVPTGNVTVQVVNNGSHSNTAAAQIQSVAPAFFMFDGGHIATTRAGGSPVAPLGQYPGSSPAKPGEIITFWGTGFGSTNPSAPDGIVLTQAYRSTVTPRIFFGNLEAVVDWAGLSATGLFQINVRVPDTTPEGEIAVTATVGGQSTQAGVTVPVKR